jgi:hypothetical protein
VDAVVAAVREVEDAAHGWIADDREARRSS